MRQRKVKNIDEKMDAVKELVIEEPETFKGRWKERFGNDNPIYLELGCGKGKFLSTLAHEKPEANFIGVEGQKNVIIRALEKANKNALNGTSERITADAENIFFICKFLNDVNEIFENGEIRGIYLNFSDPWPKERHAKRRLTFWKKLKAYEKVISKGGFIEFKTDNDELFDFTLEQIDLAEMKIGAVSRDLHGEGLPAAEVTTEYEDKFSAAGKNINYVKILV